MEQVEAVLSRGIPWNKSALWPLILVEGLVAVAVGLLIVVHPHDTEVLIIRLIGVGLVIAALFGLVGDWRRHQAGQNSSYTIIRHLIMVGVGVLAAVDPHITWVLAWGTILIGVAGLILILAVPDLGETRWGIMIASAICIVFGFLLFWALATGTFLIAVAGLALMLIGVLLVAFAIRMARGMQNAPAAPSFN